jgi:hypothetical protein
MKYLLIIVVMAIFVLLYYSFQMEKSERYQREPKISNLTIESSMGQETITLDCTTNTVLIWFHPECENCRYQLNTINSHIEQLPATRFIFITDERTFFTNNDIIHWPNLINSSQVLFGIIDRSKFISEFGPVINPSLLFFNHEGLLKEKLLGEVKIAKIVNMINKHTVPEQKISGPN